MNDFDYNVQLIRFPSDKVHEVVTPNEDGSVTIFIDKNMTFEAQQKRFLHAIKHIENNDFEKDNVQEIEHRAHFSETKLLP